VYEVVPLNGQSGDVIVRVDETVPPDVPLHVHFSKAYFENGNESPSTTAFTGLVATLLRLSSSRLQSVLPEPLVTLGIAIDTSQPAGVSLKNSTKGNVAVWPLTEVIDWNTRLTTTPAGALESPFASDIRPAGTIAPPVRVAAERPVTIQNWFWSIVPHSTLLISNVASALASAQVALGCRNAAALLAAPSAKLPVWVT